MHKRLLVTVRSADGADSESVRRQVRDRLLADDSFCGPVRRFSAPFCESFAVGGGWSGMLTETVMAGAFRDKARKLSGMDERYPAQAVIDGHATELQALWQSLGGTGPNPYARSRDAELGYPDDAMPITEPLYTSLLVEFEGCRFDGEYYADLDDEPLERGFIGRKWLVVVDYHN